MAGHPLQVQYRCRLVETEGAGCPCLMCQEEMFLKSWVLQVKVQGFEWNETDVYVCDDCHEEFEETLEAKGVYGPAPVTQGYSKAFVAQQEKTSMDLEIIGQSVEGHQVVQHHGELWCNNQLILWDGDGWRIRSIYRTIDGQPALEIEREPEDMDQASCPVVITVLVSECRVIEDVQLVRMKMKGNV